MLLRIAEDTLVESPAQSNVVNVLGNITGITQASYQLSRQILVDENAARTRWPSGHYRPDTA
jgi:hypothetical protein